MSGVEKLPTWADFANLAGYARKLDGAAKDHDVDVRLEFNRLLPEVKKAYKNAHTAHTTRIWTAYVASNAKRDLATLKSFATFCQRNHIASVGFFLTAALGVGAAFNAVFGRKPDGV